MELMVRCVAAAEGWPEDLPPGLPELLTVLPPSEPLPKIFLNILQQLASRLQAVNLSD